MNNNQAGNMAEGRFLNKPFLGIKINNNEYYFEDKKTGGGISNSNFFGYKLLNDAEENVEMRLILKRGSLYFGFFFSIIPFTLMKANFISTELLHSNDQVLIWIVFFVAYLLGGYLYAKYCYNEACTKIKKDIETRLKIREYHRTNNQPR
jgi:hypothetical protein